MRGIVIGSLAIVMATTAAAQSPQRQQSPQQPQQQPQQRPQQQPPQQPPPQQQTQQPTSADAQATMREIEQTLGFVPQYMRAIPPEMLESFWSGVQFQTSEQTALDPKIKELIGIAVAAQVPCEYCVHYHREAARAHGATDAEIKEAVGMAAMTRMGSTFLNGLNVDKNQFKKDVDRSMRSMKQSAQRNGSPRSRSKP